MSLMVKSIRLKYLLKFIIEIVKGVLKMIGKRKSTHPGEVLLEDVIKPLGLTITEVAKRLGVTIKIVSELVNCKASLSPKMAVRIGKASRTTPEI